VLHEHDDPLRTVDQVHGAAHPLDHLAGDHPVGDVAVPRDLHGTEDRGVDLAAADHAERRSRVKERRPGPDCHRLLARVDQVRVFVAVVRVGADAEDAVLGLQHDLDVIWHVVRHQGR
jgi:hypothetical protein